MLTVPIDVTIQKACLGLLFCFLTHYVWKVLESPLNSIPGPFLAKWTNLWRLFDVWGGRCELTQKLLHEKYGPVVRLGPNCVSVGRPDPNLIAKLYGIKGDCLKTNFYHSNSVFQDGDIIYTLFSETNNVRHAQMKRPIAQIYSPNGVRALEPHIDKTISCFTRRLKQEFIMGEKDKICDLDRWLSYYSWDAVGEVTFSNPFGFLEKATDVGKTMMASERSLDYFALVGQMPFLDFIFDKNPIVRVINRAFKLGLGFNFITEMSINCLQERRTGKDNHGASSPDFLDKFLEAQTKHPDTVDNNMVISYLLNNMIAGADTTAITLRSVFYYILKNAQVYRELQSEIDSSGISIPVAYQDVRSLAYLDAVIREAMRMHPGVGMPLERYAPEGGLHAFGYHIPEGVKVGMNPWVTSADRDVFGSDAEDFRPERWLQQKGETKQDYDARRKRMNRCDLTFGAGRRICIGKDLAQLNICKVVAAIMLEFEMQLADPKQEWKIQNSWFVRQEGVNVRLSPRKNAWPH
ncbi:hypothetical protein Plec18170_009704 [Paecilomyces lecythidis]